MEWLNIVINNSNNVLTTLNCGCLLACKVQTTFIKKVTRMKTILILLNQV